MMKKTNFLLVSLVAMMSVGIARAESTTKEYVDSQDTALYNRIKTQDSRLGLIRDWVNPQDPVTKKRAVLETEADDAYRAINEIHSALAGKADASDIPDVSDMETQTHAAATYQPKGSYLTSEAADAAYQPKGEYLTEHQDISGKANTADLAPVATSGDYADLSNKPTIPSVEGFLTAEDIADMETKTSAAATYQPKLTEAQLAAANSGVTTTTVAQVEANKQAIAIQDIALADKQNSLTEAQLSAVNSGIDATKVGQIATNKADIAAIHGAAQVMEDKIALKANQNYVETELGTLSNAVQSKQNLIDAEHPLSAELVDGLAPVATSGSYADLSNKPTIPAAQVNADWNATEGVAQILNKPSVYTQSETDTLLNAKANADDVYTKSETYSKGEVDNKVADVVAGDMDEALSAYVNKTTDIDSALSVTSTNPVQNKVVKSALDLKADKTGVYPKTVNVPGSGQYVLGFVDGVQMYIPIVDANGDSGEPVVAQATE